VNAIEARGLRKTYRRYGRPRGVTLKSALLGGWRHQTHARDEPAFEALKGVSFDVAAGTTVGVIGRNGSGKSTLLKLVAGIGKPSAGSLVVRGRVSALIELGAGFHPEISGRENVYINGMMLGSSKRDMAERFDEIVAFADIADFIDQPVKTYSSGMYMRLGFAVAISVDPDVLLVDEVLAVGDEAFAHKCFDKLADLRRRGRTVLLVTHALDQVLRACDAAVWIDEGIVRESGDPKRVVDAYLLDVAREENRALAARDAEAARGQVADADAAVATVALSDGPPDLSKSSEGRWGTREAEVTGVELIGAAGPAHVFRSGEAVEIRMRVVAHRPLDDFVFGIGIFAADGTCCYGTNTDVEGARPKALNGEAAVSFVIDRLDLADGTYKLDVAVHRRNGAPYDYHRLLHTFRVAASSKELGIYRPPHRWTFSGGVRMEGLE
jgi:ABC-type polysaccharide/polyol phosphate transport system ATPase subunit